MPLWYQSIRIPLLFLQSILGTLIFSEALNRKQHFPLRAITVTVFCFLCLWPTQFFYQTEQTLLYTFVRVGLHILCYLCVIGTVCFCYEESIWTVLLISSSGYIAQDLCGSLKTALKAIPALFAVAKHPIGVLFIDLFCYGGGFLLLAFLLRPYLRRRDLLNDKFKALFSFFVLLLCIGMARITQDNRQRNEIAMLSESIYQMLCDIFLFLLQFGIMERRQMRQNVDTMKELLHEQYVQFEASKENTQLVNEKYHDLKQILQGFHGQVSPSQLQKLEKQLDEYEAVTNTGNEVLDVLLSDKRTLCIQRGIQLTCYVGGAALDFVEELDLYSLFGNLLNNAIQAVSQLPPEQERFITLTARREDSMVTIHAENPCVGAVEFRDGLPKSHRDPNYHGFGMRSMERIAGKYGGSLVAKQVGDIFCLDIILFS